MSAFSVEALLCAVIQRYGWENTNHLGRQLTLPRSELDDVARTLGDRTVTLELRELPSDLLVIHTRPNER